MNNCSAKFVTVSIWVIVAISGGMIVGCQDKHKKGEITFSDFHDEKAQTEKISQLMNRRESLSHSACDSIVRDILCVSSQSNSGIDFDCSPSQVTEEQKQMFVSAFLEMPKILQNSLCQVSQIQIHDHLNFIGYTSRVHADDPTSNTTTSIIGIQSRLLLKKEAQPDFLSWKEQMRYFTEKTDYDGINVNAKAPRVSLKMKSANPQLLLVLSHEASHVYDHIKKIASLTQRHCQSFNSELSMISCRYPKHTFPSFNWGEETFLVKKESAVKIENELVPLRYSNTDLKWAKEFPFLAALCFSQCNAIVSLESVKKIYEELKKSKFPTIYSSHNPHEDFAESFSLHHLRSEKILENYQIIGEESNVHWDVIKHIEGDIYKEKRDWLNHVR